MSKAGMAFEAAAAELRKASPDLEAVRELMDDMLYSDAQIIQRRIDRIEAANAKRGDSEI